MVTWAEGEASQAKLHVGQMSAGGPNDLGWIQPVGHRLLTPAVKLCGRKNCLFLLSYHSAAVGHILLYNGSLSLVTKAFTYSIHNCQAFVVWDSDSLRLCFYSGNITIYHQSLKSNIYVCVSLKELLQSVYLGNANGPCVSIFIAVLTAVWSVVAQVSSTF